MKNLSNTNYDPTEVYNNSEESEPNTSPDKLNPDMEDLIKSNKPTDNSTNISFVYTIKDSDFGSRCSPCVVSK